MVAIDFASEFPDHPTYVTYIDFLGNYFKVSVHTPFAMSIASLSIPMYHKTIVNTM